ncbi:prevent-host-death protein [Bacteroidia bacterium]|nr:prevent-host-death protein [Bacteroidia bacterium]
MINNMRTTNYTDLRNNLKSYLDKVINDSEPLIVHRSGNESVVIISLDEYNSIKETEYIKSSPVMLERIKAAENELQAGKGKAIKTADIWK